MARLGLMGGMATETLNRITFDGKGGATPAERWDVGHRIRDVEVGPDGALWMLQDHFATICDVCGPVPAILWLTRLQCNVWFLAVLREPHVRRRRAPLKRTRGR
jgi:glucose/sorbosone dehydrogenase